jgi:hypothetical protein
MGPCHPEPQRWISGVSGEIIAPHKMTWSPAEQDDIFVTIKS